MVINGLSKYELEDVEDLKKQINNLSDYQQVEIIYNYCFDILNNSDYWDDKL